MPKPFSPPPPVTSAADPRLDAPGLPLLSALGVRVDWLTDDDGRCRVCGGNAPELHREGCPVTVLDALRVRDTNVPEESRGAWCYCAAGVDAGGEPFDLPLYVYPEAVSALRAGVEALVRWSRSSDGEHPGSSPALEGPAIRAPHSSYRLQLSLGETRRAACFALRRVHGDRLAVVLLDPDATRGGTLTLALDPRDAPKLGASGEDVVARWVGRFHTVGHDSGSDAGERLFLFALCGKGEAPSVEETAAAAAQYGPSLLGVAREGGKRGTGDPFVL